MPKNSVVFPTEVLKHAKRPKLVWPADQLSIKHSAAGHVETNKMSGSAEHLILPQSPFQCFYQGHGIPLLTSLKPSSSVSMEDRKSMTIQLVGTHVDVHLFVWAPPSSTSVSAMTSLPGNAEPLLLILFKFPEEETVRERTSS
uniref:Uncharacterized protein n=1 Tax=Nelumbo nucifera TaxID=4432 RepID=A0A822ZE04_NELNU|nr:TPA_asm: hypothetical protein HUJ06_014151 [Nelumbo nucifera]